MLCRVPVQPTGGPIRPTPGPLRWPLLFRLRHTPFQPSPVQPVHRSPKPALRRVLWPLLYRLLGLPPQPSPESVPGRVAWPPLFRLLGLPLSGQAGLPLHRLPEPARAASRSGMPAFVLDSLAGAG